MSEAKNAVEEWGDKGLVTVKLRDRGAARSEKKYTLRWLSTRGGDNDSFLLVCLIIQISRCLEIGRIVVQQQSLVLNDVRNLETKGEKPRKSFVTR